MILIYIQQVQLSQEAIHILSLSPGSRTEEQLQTVSILPNIPFLSANFLDVSLLFLFIKSFNWVGTESIFFLQ